jgi:hypothetical protein
VISSFLPHADMRGLWVTYRWVFLWWALPIGLLVKMVIGRYLLRLRWSICLMADIGMNLVSLLFVVIVPVGIVVLVALGELLERAHVVEQSHPVIWVSALLLSSLIAAAVEALLLRFVFRQTIRRRVLWLLFGASLFCLGIATNRMAEYVRAFPPVDR